MKKTYIAPITDTIKLNSEPIMGIGSVSEKEATQGASNFSRDSRNWDDEE